MAKTRPRVGGHPWPGVPAESSLRASIRVLLQEALEGPAEIAIRREAPGPRQVLLSGVARVGEL